MEAVRSSPSVKILNDGSATRASFLGSTCRFDKPSAIDTTIVSQGPVLFSNWRTHDQSSSDHFVITFDMIIPPSLPQATQPPPTATRLLSKTLCTRHKAKLHRYLEDEALSLDLMGLHITDAVDMLTQAVCRAVERAEVLSSPPSSKKPKSQHMTKKCIQLRKVRRQAERHVRSFVLPHGKRHTGLSTLQLATNPSFQAAKANLSHATRQLNTALRQSRTDRWRLLVSGMDLSTQPATVWKTVKMLQVAKDRNLHGAPHNLQHPIAPRPV